jgi:hypothetical protein
VGLELGERPHTYALVRLHTHTGFLRDSNPAPVVEIFTRTGLPLPVASTDHARSQSDVERRTGQTCQTFKFQCSYIETDRPLPARRPTRVQVRHASLADRQLGGACADRLRVITRIHLHCTQLGPGSSVGITTH